MTSTFKSLFRAFRGLGLALRYTRQFPVHYLEGKRIVIVGPANSALGTGAGKFIDSFDVVVRLNKAPILLEQGKYAVDIGTKIDVLFHSFFENEFSGGGSLDFDLYARLGIKYVVQPVPTLDGWRVIFNFYKKYLRKQIVYILQGSHYGAIKSRFGTYKPTTGFCALSCLMEANFSELAIIGFTFFKTSYSEGYRDDMKEVAKARDYIEKMKIHNPDLEFKEFMRIWSLNRHKRITLDRALQLIVHHDGK